MMVSSSCSGLKPQLTLADTQRLSPLRRLSTKSVPSDMLKPARDFISFVNDSPTPFHAVHQSVERELAPLHLVRLA